MSEGPTLMNAIFGTLVLETLAKRTGNPEELREATRRRTEALQILARWGTGSQVAFVRWPLPRVRNEFQDRIAAAEVRTFRWLDFLEP